MEINLCGKRCDNARKIFSSLYRTTRSSNSAADEIISNKPRILVLLVSDKLNNSTQTENTKKIQRKYTKNIRIILK